MPTSSDRSVTRAARLADRTETNVAPASTSVPPAVANDEIVVQSVTGGDATRRRAESTQDRRHTVSRAIGRTLPSTTAAPTLARRDGGSTCGRLGQETLVGDRGRGRADGGAGRLASRRIGRAGRAASVEHRPTPAAFSVQVAIAPSLLQSPTAIATASDGRIFVAEIGGVIKVFHGITDTHPKVFADLSNEVYSAQGHGLLGMTLDPHFPTKPYVYVLYSRDSATRGGPIVAKKDTCATHATTGCVRYARLARLTAKGDTMVAGSMKVLVDDWCNQFVHHIGALHFGKDGMLYASGGDGATEQVNGASGADYGQFGNACGDPPSPAGTNLTAPTAQGGSLRSAGHPRGIRHRPGHARRHDHPREPDHRSGGRGQPVRVGDRPEPAAHRGMGFPQPVPLHDPSGHERHLRVRPGPRHLRGDRPHPEPHHQGTRLRLALLGGNDPAARVQGRKSEHVQLALRRAHRHQAGVRVPR